MRGDPNPKVQVAGLRPAAPRFAFASDPDARSVAYAGRNSHVDRAGAAIVFDGEAPHSAPVRVLEAQLELLLDVASLAWPASATAGPPTGVVARRGICATEERVKEV